MTSPTKTPLSRKEDMEPTEPTDIDKGDKELSTITPGGYERTPDTDLAQAHYLRSIAVSLANLAGIAIHNHEQHTEHEHKHEESENGNQEH